MSAPQEVSIHAPARGATLHHDTTQISTMCFNPRARTGRDRLYRCQLRQSPSFNPRARTGRDRRKQPERYVQFAVSIHAPARGATSWRGKPYTKVYTFQSTRPHGARRIHMYTKVYICKCFNPRARTGRDADRDSLYQYVDWFQSTRPHGARQMTDYVSGG